jgi:Domain of unknown function DUF11/Bacterial Ig domain
MFSFSSLTNPNPTWLIVAGLALLSFVLKNQILKLIKTLTPQKLFSVGFSFVLILSVGLTGNGASALEALANNPEIQKAEIAISSDKIAKELETQSSSQSSINSSVDSVTATTVSPESSENSTSSISSTEDSQISTEPKTKKTQEKTTLESEIKLTIPDVSDKFGEVKIDLSAGTEVKTEIKEIAVESNPINEVLRTLGFVSSQTSSQINETQIINLDTSTITADQTPEINAEKLTFDFGNPNEHLIFSKPVKIQTNVESNQTSFDVQVTHKGDSKPSANGLSLNSETCENNNSESLTVPVVDGKITFYTCGASTFSITPSAGTSPIVYPANGSTVNANTTFVGTGSVNGATIDLTIPPSTTVIGTATVKNGQWSITPTSPLPVGSNTVCVGAACNTFTVAAASTFQGLSCKNVYGSTFVSPVGTGQTQIVQYNPVTDVKNTLPFTLPVTFGATRAVAVSPDGTTITYYDDTQTRFESYNTFTGATVNGPATAMAGIPNTAFNRLGYNSIGEIYSLVTIAAAPSSTYLIKVNPATLAATNLGILTDKAGNAISVSALGGGDLIFDNADKGYLIDNSGYFFKIDISTRVATFLATAPATTPAGLAYGPNGLIYTFTSAAPNGNIYAIDLAANTITLMETQTGTVFADAFGCAYPDIAPKPSAGKTPAIVTGAAANGTGGTVSTSPATILSPGDLVEYSVVLRNGGITAGTNSKYQDTLPSGTTYVANSTKMNTVAVTDGAGSTFPYAVAKLVNSPGAAAGVVSADLTPAITTDKEVTITYRVRISDPFTATPRQVSNQGTFTSDDFVTIQTDNPATTTPGDATITPINTPPVAVDDNYTTTPGTAVTLTPLTGDTDVNTTQTLKVTKIGTTTLTPGTAQVITVTNGTVNVTAAGVITFTPTAGFTGLATIPYTISDGAGGTATANEKITVAAAPAITAVDDRYTITQGSSLFPNPLAQDTYGATIQSIGGLPRPALNAPSNSVVLPGQGTLTITDSAIVFTPFPTFSGVITIPYVIQDANGNTATANEIITVLPAPCGPAVVEFSNTMTYQGLGNPDGTSFTSGGVIINYTGTGVPPESAFAGAPSYVYTQVEGGSVVQAGSITQGNWIFQTFVLNGQTYRVYEKISFGFTFFSVDLSYYTIDNGPYQTTEVRWEGSGAQTNTITYLQYPKPQCPPTAVDDNYTTTVGTPKVLAPLTGDTDPDTTTLTITDINGTAITPGTAQTITVTGGTVTLSATGVITFNPAAGFIGVSTFPYTISDGTTTSTAKETILITPASNAVCTNKIVNGTFDTNLASWTAAPEWTWNNGTAAFVTDSVTNKNLNQTISNYVVNGGYTTFKIQLQPAEANNTTTETARLNIRFGNVSYLVITNPIGTGDVTYGTANGASYSVDTTVRNQLATIYLTVPTAITTPQLLEFRHLTGKDDWYIYSIENLDCTTPVALVATNDNYTTQPDTVVTLTPLVNDTAGTTIKSVNGVTRTPGVAQTITTPNGTVKFTAGGIMTFQPNLGYVGDAIFPYVIQDTSGNTATANIKVTVPNLPPLAVDDSYYYDNATGAGLPITLTPLTGDTDPNRTAQNPLSIVSINGVTLTPGTAQSIPVINGTVTVSATGLAQFLPTPGYNGTVAFPYVIKDPQGLTSTANETITMSQCGFDVFQFSDRLTYQGGGDPDQNLFSNTLPVKFITTASASVPLESAFASSPTIAPSTTDYTAGTGPLLNATWIFMTTVSNGKTIKIFQNILNNNSYYSVDGGPLIFGGVETIEAGPQLIYNFTYKLPKICSSPITATNDNYTTTGTTPVTLTPLTGDTAGTTIKSIGGVDLTPGTAQTITVPNGTVTIDAAGVIKFTPTAGFTGDATIPYVITDTAGNTATANEKITVSAAPAILNIKANKTADKTNTFIGDNIIYTLDFENIGTADASGATIKDTLPAAVNVNSISCVATGGAVCPLPTSTAAQLSSGVVVNTFPAGSKLTYTVNTTVTGNEAPAFVNWTSTGNNTATGTLNGVPMTLTRTILTPSCMVSGNTVIYGTQTEAQQLAKSGFSPTYYTPQPTATTNWLDVGVDQNYCPANNGNQTKVTLNFSQPVKDPTIHILNLDAGQMVFDAPFTATKVSGNSYFEVAGNVFNSVTNGATITGCGTGSNGTQAGCGSALASGYYNSISFFLNDTTPVPGNGDGFQMTISTIPVATTVQNCAEATVASGQTDSDTTNNNKCVSVTIAPPFVNSPPVAVNDSYTTPIGTPKVLTPLTGDTDPDAGQTLTVTKIGTTVLTPGIAQTITFPEGVVTTSTTGVITFTPNPTFTGVATIPYTISDGNGGTAVANEVIAIIKAVDDLKTTPAGVPVTYNPLTNDSVPVGSIISKINGVTPVVGTPISVPGGTVTLNADGTITVIPTPGSTTPITFPYEVTTPDGTKVTATDTITVIKAVDDVKTIVTGTPTTYDPKSNDVNIPTGSTITKIGNTPVVIGTPIPVTGGTVTVNADGTITVTPTPGSNAPVTFPYEITTPDGTKVTANDTLNQVNAVDDTKSTPAGVPATYNPLTNDSVPVGSTISKINGVTPVVGTPIPVPGGTVTLNADGTITVTPTPGSTTPIVFPYEVTTPDGTKTTATDTITVTNQPPVAVDDNYTTTVGVPVVLTPLTADTDQDGNVLTVTKIGTTVITPGTAQTIPVTNGTVTISATGVIVFTPAPGFVGTATIPYTISDGNGGTATANELVNIPQIATIELDKAATYNDTNGNASGDVGETITYKFTVKNTGNVPLTNVTISDPTVTIIGGPIATLAVGATDTTTFTATHVVTAADISAGFFINTATASGTPPVGPAVTDVSNDPNTPEVNDPTKTLIPPFAFPDLKGTAINTAVTYNPLANDILPSGSTLKLINGVVATPGTTIPVTNGSVLINADGTITVTPAPGFTGTITFPYVVQTIAGDYNSVDTVNVYKAVDETKTTPAGTPVTYSPMSNDVVPSGSTITKIGTTPVVIGTPITIPNGTVTVNADGSVTVTPNPGYTGTLTFPYEVTTPDGVKVTANDTVNVVSAVNDTKTTQAGSPITYNPLTNDNVPTGSTITKIGNTPVIVGTPITITDPITGIVTGTVLVNNDGTVTVTPAPGSTTPVVFSYEVTTPDGTKVTATDTITVIKAIDDVKTTPVGVPVTYNPIANDVNIPTGSTITKIGTTPVVIGSPITVPGGTVTVNSDGTITVSPTPGSTTPVVFVYEVTTPNGVKTVATDTINQVKAVDDVKTTPINTPVTYNPLTNDTVPTGSTITKINGVTPVVGTPITVPGGTVTLNPDGTVTVTPAPGSNVPVTFSYEVTTPDGVKVTANDTVNIVDAKMEVTKVGTFVDTDNNAIASIGDKINYTFTVKNTGNVALTDINITDNKCSPVLGGPLTTLAVNATISNVFTCSYTLVAADISAGKVTNSANGTAKDPSGNPVTDVSDSTDPTKPGNDDPTVTLLPIKAVDDVKTTPAGSPITYNPLTNDNVSTGSAITKIGNTPVVIGTPITVPGGTVTVNADGTVTVTPTPGSTTPIVFVYEVTTPDGVKTTATDTINQVKAVDDVKTTPVGTPVTYNPLTNDVNIPTGSTITKIGTTPVVVGTPIPVPGGTVTVNADGTITVSPTPGSTAPIVFVYEVTTPDGTKVTATDTITPLKAVDDTNTVLVGTPITYNPLANDNLPTGTTITKINGVTPVVGTPINITDPITGTVIATVVLNPDGTITVTPKPGYTGPTVFPYEATTPDGTKVTAVDTINQNNPKLEIDKASTYNDANGNGSGDVGETISYTFTVKNVGNVPLTNITVTDPGAVVSGGPIALLAVGAVDTTTFTAIHTVVAADIAAGKFINTATATGTPPNNPDGSPGTPVTDLSNDPKTVPADPTNPNDPKANDPTVTLIPPYVYPDTRTTIAGVPVTYNPMANDIVPTGSTVTKINGVTPVVGTPIPVNGGTVTLNADGTFTVTPAPEFTGTITFPYTVTTPDLLALETTNTVTVIKANDDTVTTPQGTPAIYNPLTNDNVPPGSTITKINGVTPVVGTPIPVNGGTVTLNPDGTITVTPTPGSTVPVTFPYEVTTPDGTKVTANDTVNVQAPSGNAITITPNPPTKPTADLSVIKLGDKVKTAVGDTLTYTIAVKNNGAVTVNNSTVQDVLPAGYNVTSITCSSTSGSICPNGITASQLNNGLIIPSITAGGEVKITIVGTVTTIVQLINKAEVKNPSDVLDPNPENNISEFPTVFDPPSGKKIGTYKGKNIVEWKQVWINEKGRVAVNATITDDIPQGTEYVPNSLKCLPQGKSTTTICEFNSANNSTTWIGSIGEDYGNVTEETAANEVIVAFQILIPADMNEVENQSQITTDLGTRKSDNPNTNEKLDITKVVRTPEIVAILQSNIEDAKDLAVETIRTGGANQTIGYSGIILGLMMIVSFLAFKSKENE